VGGVSEGSTRESWRGAIHVGDLSRAQRWKASRSAGWRRPSRDAVGMQTSVGQCVGNGTPPLPAGAPATADVQRAPRKGMSSACTLRSACTGREKLEKASHAWSSTRPSLGPLTRARRSPLQLRRGNPAEVAPSSRYRGRENLAEARRTGTGVETRGQCAARRVSPLRASEGSVRRQKRKGVMASVPARIVRARAECSYVVAVAEIGRRRLVPNTHGKRAPKRADRVE
jgi:hypothetical protein